MNNCPICESTKVKELLSWKKYSIQKCTDCKLIFATPLPSDKELTEFYQGFMFNKPEEYEIQKQIKTRKKELKNLFKLPKQMDGLSGKKFLDYGGGTGVAFKTISEFGIDSYYHDLDEEAKGFSKKYFGLTKEKIVDEITSCTIQFDYIFSDNVIEHVKDPQEFVLNLMNQLNSGGKIIIKTPHASNTDVLFNPFITVKGYFMSALKYNSFIKSIKAYLLRFWSCDPPRHLYSFSKDSLDQLMANMEMDSFSHEILYYENPWFNNTITKQVFSKDKKLKGITSILIRLLVLPIIPFELVLQVTRKLLLKIGILSPGGIILAINKRS